MFLKIQQVIGYQGYGLVCGKRLLSGREMTHRESRYPLPMGTRARQ